MTGIAGPLSSERLFLELLVWAAAQRQQANRPGAGAAAGRASARPAPQGPGTPRGMQDLTGQAGFGPAAPALAAAALAAGSADLAALWPWLAAAMEAAAAGDVQGPGGGPGGGEAAPGGPGVGPAAGREGGAAEGGHLAARAGERRGGRFYDLFVAAARRHGLDPDLLWAVARAESGLNPHAVSPAGAMGLMQLMPATARALGVRDPFDPEQNVEAGARYLRQQLERFGDIRLALAAYNAGPHAVERYGGVPPYRETQAYVERVLALWRQQDGGGSPSQRQA